MRANRKVLVYVQPVLAQMLAPQLEGFEMKNFFVSAFTVLLPTMLLAPVAQAATLLAADGRMGFASNDACGAAVQSDVAQGYVAPTTASAGQHKGYKKFTLAQLGKVNGLCVTGDSKYKVDVVVYLPSTFEVAVKVDKAGKPVNNWEQDVHMWKCMNKILKIWTIDPKPAVVKPAVPAVTAPTPTIWYQVEKGVAPVDCQCSIPVKATEGSRKGFPGAFFPGLEGKECLAAKLDFAKRHDIKAI